MSKLSVKNGDTVLVISGKDNGKVAKVKAVSPKSSKVVVEGVNIVAKHKKARSAQEKSQIIRAEAPIDASNVMVVCPHCQKATRVAHKEVDGKMARICKKCEAVLDAKYVKPKKDKKAETKVEAKKSTKKAEAKVEEKAEVTTEKKTTAKKTTTKATAKKQTKTEDAKKTTTKKASKKA